MKVFKNILPIVRWIWQPKKLPYLCQMKVKFKDNEQVVAVANSTALVYLMKDNTHTEGLNLQEYMKSYAHRAILLNNEDIRATNVDDFVSDLIKLGHIELI